MLTDTSGMAKPRLKTLSFYLGKLQKSEIFLVQIVESELFPSGLCKEAGKMVAAKAFETLTLMNSTLTNLPVGTRGIGKMT